MTEATPLAPPSQVHCSTKTRTAIDHSFQHNFHAFLHYFHLVPLHYEVGLGIDRECPSCQPSGRGNESKGTVIVLDLCGQRLQHSVSGGI